MEDISTTTSNTTENVLEKRLLEFSEYFVSAFEGKLTGYCQVLDGKATKSGKMTDCAKIFLGGASDGACSILPHFVPGIPTRAIVRILKSIGDKSIQGIGETKHKKKAASLSDLVYHYNRNENKFRMREILVESSFDIFQSFEMQFMDAVCSGGETRAMMKFANDAVNRIINYLSRTQSTTEDFSRALIAQGVLFGESKRTKLPKLKPGRSINKKNPEIEWNTDELYRGVGIAKQDKNTYEFYKKKGSNTKKYGYRRLFVGENWGKMHEQNFEHDFNGGTSYQYQLNPKNLESETGKILQHLNDRDPQLMEDRITKISKKTQNELSFDLRNLRSAVNEVIDVLENLEDSFINTVKDEMNGIHKKLDTLINNDSYSKIEPIWFEVKEAVPIFIQQDQALTNLHKFIQTKSTVVSGLGGIGKSELVKKYAKEKIYDYDGNIIWIETEKHETVKQSLDRLAKEINRQLPDNLKIRTNDDLEQGNKSNKDEIEKDIGSVITEIYKHFSNTIKKKSLFIFDNVQEYDNIICNLLNPLLYLGPGSIKPFILITSRYQKWPEDKFNKIVVKQFNKNDSKLYIKEHLKISDEIKISDDELENLADILQGIPLVLLQTVSYIQATKMPIREYLGVYEKEKEKLLQSMNEERDKAVYTVWQVTINKIEQTENIGKLALKIFEIMSCLASDSISRSFFQKIRNEDYSIVDCSIVDKAIELLTNYSMIKKNYHMIRFEKNVILNMHRTVQEVTFLKLKERTKDILKMALSLTKAKDEDHAVCVWKHASKYKDLINEFYFKSSYGEKKNKPIHLLAQNGHDEAIESLITIMKEQNKLDDILQAKNDNNAQPLHLAAGSGNKKVVELLLKNGAKIVTKEKYNWTPLHLASQNGFADVVDAFLKLLNKEQYKQIILCQTRFKFTPLHLASHNGHVAVTNLLLEALVDKKLLAEAMSPTTEGFLPLHLAAQKGHTDTVNALLVKKAKIDEKTKYDFTALHIAANKGHLEVSKTLVANEANILAETQRKFTPLHFAAQKGHKEIVNVLLKALLDNKQVEIAIDAKTKEQLKTPLHFASYNGHFEIIYTLLSNGANINAEDEFGLTPIFAMICNANEESKKVVKNLAICKISKLLMDIHKYRSFISKNMPNFLKLLEAFRKQSYDDITNALGNLTCLKADLSKISGFYSSNEDIKKLCNEATLIEYIRSSVIQITKEKFELEEEETVSSVIQITKENFELEEGETVDKINVIFRKWLTFINKTHSVTHTITYRCIKK